MSAPVVIDVSQWSGHVRWDVVPETEPNAWRPESAAEELARLALEGEPTAPQTPISKSSSQRIAAVTAPILGADGQPIDPKRGA